MAKEWIGNTQKYSYFSLLEGAMIMDYLYTQGKKFNELKWREPKRGSEWAAVSLIMTPTTA